ncbi:MAG: hypothetical protein QOD56_1131 [Gammaproteobacteria bacterium]|jgi:hypothetical protein|nr:hypothetical protein [Gammaproteobacteria bacterium]
MTDRMPEEHALLKHRSDLIGQPVGKIRSEAPYFSKTEAYLRSPSSPSECMPFLFAKIKQAAGITRTDSIAKEQ